MPASCAACWSDAPAWTPPSGALLLDWVMPADEDAPLQAVAMPEARARWPGPAGPAPTVTMQRVWPLARAAQAPQLVVQDGPAWNGYVGTALQVTRPGRVARGRGEDWAAWAAHVALVEVLLAGDEGSAVPRQLVRAVAGPLPLAALATQPRLSHVQALRVPQGGQPGRWQTVGWLTWHGEPQVAARAAVRDCP